MSAERLRERSSDVHSGLRALSKPQNKALSWMQVLRFGLSTASGISQGQLGEALETAAVLPGKENQLLIHSVGTYQAATELRVFRCSSSRPTYQSECKERVRLPRVRQAK